LLSSTSTYHVDEKACWGIPTDTKSQLLAAKKSQRKSKIWHHVFGRKCQSLSGELDSIKCDLFMMKDVAFTMKLMSTVVAWWNTQMSKSKNDLLMLLSRHLNTRSHLTINVVTAMQLTTTTIFDTLAFRWRKCGRHAHDSMSLCLCVCWCWRQCFFLLVDTLSGARTGSEPRNLRWCYSFGSLLCGNSSTTNSFQMLKMILSLEPNTWG